MSERHQGMRMNADAGAQYKKLSEGGWGVWTDVPNLRPGQQITVTTRSGQLRLERLDCLLTTHNGRQLWKLKERTE